MEWLVNCWCWSHLKHSTHDLVAATQCIFYIKNSWLNAVVVCIAVMSFQHLTECSEYTLECFVGLHFFFSPPPLVSLALSLFFFNAKRGKIAFMLNKCSKLWWMRYFSLCYSLVGKVPHWLQQCRMKRLNICQFTSEVDKISSKAKSSFSSSAPTRDP